jgi:pimeloyl-ACP methyl ester carboxylesterase
MDVIMVPGLWLDASSWQGVIPVLQTARHTAHPMTMPGVGAGHPTDIGMAEWIGAVVRAIDGIEGPVALVGHSGGGNVVHGAVDARPDRVSRAIYLDTFPPVDGGIVWEFPVVDGVVPFPGWGAFDDADVRGLDDDVRDAMASRMRDVPAAVPTQPISLHDDRRFDVPATVIMSSHSAEEMRAYMRDGADWALELTRIRDLEIIDLPTGHWPQFSRPADVGEALVQALAG